jgi:hypothetical protein
LTCNDLSNLATIFKFKISRNWEGISFTKFHEKFATFIVKLD